MTKEKKKLTKDKWRQTNCKKGQGKLCFPRSFFLLDPAIVLLLSQHRIRFTNQKFRKFLPVIMKYRNHILLLWFLPALVKAPTCNMQKRISNPHQRPLKFDFGASAKKGYIIVDPQSIYNGFSGFGFEPGDSVMSVKRNNTDALYDGFVTSDKPFFFSVKIPEGNYDVKVAIGDPDGACDLVVRAECRRSMTERIVATKNEFKTVSTNFGYYFRK